MKGEILKKLRLEKGLSTKELSDHIGISISFIKMIESGQRNASEKNIKNIANFFGVSTSYLKGEEASVDDKLTQFLNILIDEGLIEDTDNIDPKMQSLIMHYVKKEIDKIKQEKLK